MPHKTNQTTTKNPSMLTLDDNCLMHILKFLELRDLVNLAATCVRLRDVCPLASSNKKFEEICIDVERFPLNRSNSRGNCNRVSCSNNKSSKRNLSFHPNRNHSDYGLQQVKANLLNVWSIIGSHVLKIEVDSGHSIILQSIRENCKNLTSIELRNFDGQIPIKDFRNLKELKMDFSNNNDSMSIKELRSCYASNTDLECIEYERLTNVNFIGLLEMWPKLKSLHLGYLYSSFHRTTQFHHLLRLKGLTKFSFRSSENCDELLNQLSKHLNLTELRIEMIVHEDTFNIVRSFLNLEVLSMESPNGIWDESLILESLTFPQKLKRINLIGIKMSSKAFLSIVRQLQFLEEFDFDHGQIFCELDKCKRLH